MLSIVPSGITLMDGVVNFVMSFPEWERVAIVSQDTEMFRMVSTESYSIYMVCRFLPQACKYRRTNYLNTACESCRFGWSINLLKLHRGHLH